MASRTTASGRKPSGLLAAFAETKKPPTVLLGDIQAHVVKKTQDNDRRQNIIHPSEMCKEDWCPRATAYRISGEQPSNPATSNGHRLETIFQEGHDIHTKWQSWLGEMGRLWGRWVCDVCGSETYDVGQQPCKACGRQLMTYREVPLDAETSHMICGHADGAVLDVRSLIEIKSIGLGTVRMEEPSLVSKYTVKTEAGKSVVDYDALWKGIKRPLLTHRKQAGIYLFIARLMDIDVDQMVFIYENKANQDTKEFAIRYSEDLIEPLIDLALDIKWAVENNRVLPRPKDFTKDAKPCLGCAFRDLCWSNHAEESHPQSHLGDGARLTGGQKETGSAEDLHADQAGRRVPRTAGRPHRTGRQRTDEALRPADEVGGVPERPTGSSRGRRTVRRSHTREDQGDRGL